MDSFVDDSREDVVSNGEAVAGRACACGCASRIFCALSIWIAVGGWNRSNVFGVVITLSFRFLVAMVSTHPSVLRITDALSPIVSFVGFRCQLC